MFVSQGVPLWDADRVRELNLLSHPSHVLHANMPIAMQAVHDLYAKGGAAVEAVGAAFPACIEEEGTCLSTDAVPKFSLMLSSLWQCLQPW